MLCVTNLNAFHMSLEEDLFPTPLQHHSSFCSTTDHGPTRGIARSGIGRCHSHLRKSPFRCSQFQHLEISFLPSLAYQSAPILPSLQWRWERHWHWTLADLPIWECDCIGAQWDKWTASVTTLWDPLHQFPHFWLVVLYSSLWGFQRTESPFVGSKHAISSIAAFTLRLFRLSDLLNREYQCQRQHSLVWRSQVKL